LVVKVVVRVERYWSENVQIRTDDLHCETRLDADCLQWQILGLV